MKVLVTYAVDPEFAPWLKLCKFEKIAAGKFVVQRTKIGVVGVDFLVTGMGPEFAQSALDAVRAVNYDACIAAGFAGSLRAQYQVGDILIPASVRRLGLSSSVLCDPVLVEAASAAKPGRTLLSSEQIVASATEKARLAELADAVDMESYAVISAAQARSIPVIAVRVISDTHDQEMPVDFSRSLDQRGQVSVGAVLRQLAGEPTKIATVMRLGRQSKIAADALAQFLLAYIPVLPQLPLSDSQFLASSPVPGA